MRRVRTITDEEARFRMENVGGFARIRRDPIEPEPVGTIILVPMRVVGYDPDCDGSLMARLEKIDLDDVDDGICPEIVNANMRDAESYGVMTRCGLYDTSGLVVTPEEVRALFGQAG